MRCVSTYIADMTSRSSASAPISSPPTGACAWRGPGSCCWPSPTAGAGKRFGVTVTKKIGNAVVRNRMKRRFRALLRAALPGEGLADHDHVLIGREGGIERDFALLRDELAARARARRARARAIRRAAASRRAR